MDQLSHQRPSVGRTAGQRPSPNKRSDGGSETLVEQKVGRRVRDPRRTKGRTAGQRPSSNKRSDGGVRDPRRTSILKSSIEFLPHCPGIAAIILIWKSNASVSLSGTPTTRTGELLETVWRAARCQCAEPTGVSRAWPGEVPIARELYDSIDQKIELERFTFASPTCSPQPRIHGLQIIGVFPSRVAASSFGACRIVQPA